MLKNYIHVALRNLRRHKLYSLINIFGLAVGMACSLIIFLHIAHEFSYDRQSPAAGRTYRITAEFQRGERSSLMPYIPAGPTLAAELPEVEAEARLFTYSWKEKALIGAGPHSFYEEGFFLADPGILDMLAIPLLQGDARSALADSGRILLSESAARKYFGTGDPLGKTLAVKNMIQADFVVAGVFRDVPANAHFHPNFIAPIEAGNRVFWPGFLERNSFFTYIRLKPGASAAVLQAKLGRVLGRRLGNDAAFFTFMLQPLTDIHLRSHMSGEIEANGDLKSVGLLALLAWLVLIGACINFVNLTTARSESRAKEVGLRKTVGAIRPQIVRQFLAESCVLALAAVGPALFLVWWLWPAFQSLMNVRRPLSAVPVPMFLAILAGLLAFIGLAAGSYPALVLSRFAPSEILRGRVKAGYRRSLSRSVLVVVQSAAAVILMAGTVMVLFQMRYIQNKNLGFDKEQVVILRLKDYEAQKGYAVLKSALARLPDIVGVAASESLPSEITRRHPAWHEGAEAGVEEPILWTAVDYSFLDVYGMKLAAGREFSRDKPSDEKRAYIINETAARAFGWAEPVGKGFALSNKNLARPMFEKGEVIGVVRDFHFQSLHKPIEPVVLSIREDSVNYAAVKIRPGRIAQALAALTEAWKRVFPGRPFDYFFFDENVARMYASERRIGRMFGAGAALSLFLSALGLFGLASFSAAKRTREIGIRKTLGASVRDIAVLLSKEFALLFVAANMIAWPAAYLLTKKWLMGFAYRIAAGPQIFLLASVAAGLILTAAVGFQALKAALANPVESLRYE